jgi:hypothetical protein
MGQRIAPNWHSASYIFRLVRSPLAWGIFVFIIAVLGLTSTGISSSSAASISHRIKQHFCPSPYTFTTTFGIHEEYRDLAPSADRYWDELLTSNGGFLELESRGEQTTFGISMFHQLHCLQMIRSSLQQALMLDTNASADHSFKDGMSAHMHHDKTHERDSGVADLTHMIHCFDYLRQVGITPAAPKDCIVWLDQLTRANFQSILCCADGTLEETFEITDKGPVINGYTSHQCREATPLYLMSETGQYYTN